MTTEQLILTWVTLVANIATISSIFIAIHIWRDADKKSQLWKSLDFTACLQQLLELLHKPPRRRASYFTAKTLIRMLCMYDRLDLHHRRKHYAKDLPTIVEKAITISNFDNKAEEYLNTELHRLKLR